VIEYREAYLENVRLRRMLDFGKSQAYRMAAARVIRRDLTGEIKTIVLDQGERNGVRKGQQVLVDAGVVGRVLEVTRSTARVLLLTDENSQIDAMLQNTRINGILRGSGRNVCQLRYVAKTETVRAGDVILTSGLSGGGPKGLPLGIVRRVEHDETSMFWNVEVVPFVELLKLEEAFIVTGEW
jgi:rod shape-determining protein MreC